MSNPESLPFLAQFATKTVIITGGAGGIGAATAKVFNDREANVVIADIPKAKENAEILISDFSHPHKAIYVPVDITDWAQMTNLFRITLDTFGGLDTVVANAGIMESTDALDIETTDSDGDLLPSTNAFDVIDVNLKGTLNSKSCLASPCPFWPVYGYIVARKKRRLRQASFATGNAPYDFSRQQVDFQKIHRAGIIHLWVFRQHGDVRIHFIQARDHRASPWLSTHSREIRNFHHWSCPLLYSHEHDLSRFGALAGRRGARKHPRSGWDGYRAKFHG